MEEKIRIYVDTGGCLVFLGWDYPSNQDCSELKDVNGDPIAFTVVEKENGEIYGLVWG